MTDCLPTLYCFIALLREEGGGKRGGGREGKELTLIILKESKLAFLLHEVHTPTDSGLLTPQLMDTAKVRGSLLKGGNEASALKVIAGIGGERAK